MKDYFNWENFGMDRVSELAKADPEYQALWDAFEQVYARYIGLFQSLTAQQQAVLVDYECGLGNLRYFETMLAYELGRNTPRVCTDSSKPEKNSCNPGKSML